jgi:hypothetical protein
MRSVLAVLIAVCGMLQAESMFVELDCSQALDPAFLRTEMGRVPDVPGMVRSGEPGAPSLPVMPVQVLLPPGTRAVSVRVLEAGRAVFSQFRDPKPAQHGVPISRPEDFVPVGLSPGAVERAARLPVVSLAGQGTLMGYPVADVLVRPYRWDPDREALVVAAPSAIELELEPGGPVPPPRGTAGTRAVRRVLAASVVNPAQLSAYPARPATDLPWGEYLVVTTAGLEDAFEPLAEYKTVKGIPAEMVTMDYITDVYSGVDEAQSLRFFLRDIYDDSPPTYVLLAGDTPDVPHRECWSTAEGLTAEFAADLYFQDMNDTAPGVDLWDADGDGTWGEIGEDVMDYHPDYILGRAPVETVSEAETFVDKALVWEDGPDTDAWYTSMGFTTGVLWTSPYCPGSAGKEKVDTLYTPEWWQIEKHYESEGTQSYALTMDMLNRGMQLVNHAGHGSETYVSIGTGGLDNSDFESLTNISQYGRPSIWNTIACLSGSFHTGTCLGEAWIRSENGGGFCMMNAHYGWGEPSEPGDQWSELVDQEFFAKFFTEDMYLLGSAHAMAKDEFIPLIPSDTHYDWINKALNLFGDPELPMYSEAPAGELQLDVPEEIAPGQTTVEVGVTDDDGPVDSARVCLMQGPWSEPVAYAVDYTSASGGVSVTADFSQTPDSVLVTAWARNHSPQTVVVPIGPEATAGPASAAAEPFYLSAPSRNPASGPVQFDWASGPRPAQLAVYDLSGRRVALLAREMEGIGVTEWNLRDDGGRPVPSGVYLVRLSGLRATTSRLVVIR